MSQREKIKMLPRKILTLLLTISLVVSSATVATASHSWGSYHWAITAKPFTLKLGDNLSTKWKPFLGEASTQWSASDVLDTSIVPGAKKGNCGAVSGRVEVCNARYGSNGWLGIASIWLSGSHITQGSVKLNDSYFDTSTYNKDPWRRLVMCQEVGHTFGLGHTDELMTNVNDGTCMDYTNSPAGGGTFGLSNESPNSHDFDQLRSIYGHLDSTTTIKSTTSSVGKSIVESFNDPSSWGQSIGHKDSRGRSSHFELDLGNGEKLFTFVIWADNN